MNALSKVSMKLNQHNDIYMAGERGSMQTPREVRRAEHAQANRRPEVAKKMMDREANQQSKMERDAAQAVVDAQQMERLKQEMIEASFFDDEKPKNLSEGGAQEGGRFGKETVTITGPSTESYSSGLPGMDAKTLGKGMAESRKREEAGENLDVQEVVVEKPSVWSRFKNLFKSTGMESKTSSTPFGSRKEIKTLGEKMRAPDAVSVSKTEVDEQEDYKKAA